VSFLPVTVYLCQVAQERKIGECGLPSICLVVEGYPDASCLNCKVAWATDDQTDCDPIAGIHYITTILDKQA